MKKTITFFILLIISFNLYSQVPEPVKIQKGIIVLYDGTIHIGNGRVINNGYIIFENGKISQVSEGNYISENKENETLKINLKGENVYPGLILPNSKIGLEDISAVRATLDHTEIGDINSNIRSIIAYNTDSEMIATFRFNGILLSQVVPDGELITGNSSIMMMEGWNWEDAAYRIDNGLHIKWPRKTFPPNRWRGSTEFRENPNYKKTVDKIHKFLIDSRSYYDLKDMNDQVNLKLDPMISVFSGKKKVYIHANSREQIIESVQTFKRHGINNLVIVGANDANYAIDFLKENNLPVLLNNLHRVPSRNHEDIHLSYKLPYLLHKEGLLVGLTASGSSLNESRNLPFFAGTAAAYGLSKNDALKMITYNNAKILGIDEVTGSLEIGKDANIIVSEGDILDMKSSKIKMAFIKGKRINLKGKQQILYDRFKRKYSE